MKFLLYIILSWIVFRWLNRIFGGSRQQPHPPPRPHGDNKPKSKKPDSDKIGDYVDYEEVDD
jgi:hypothetical protein|tara:strand:+ start:76 stop:261 length:186 start_codon:yes stop_codon:yes gene_type:complete